MALGLYSGLRNRETRIRKTREELEKTAAANEEWQRRFDETNKANWKLWFDQNKITNEQNVQAAKAAAEAQKARDEATRAHERDMAALAQAYRVINDQTEFENFVKRSEVTFGLTEQSAVNAQGRLEAWDDKKHNRDTASQIEIMVQRIGLETEAAKDRIRFELNRKAEINTQAAITAHANAMQQVLLERVLDGKVIGADFAAAVGGTTDATAQIAQYSAAITALGVSKDNPVLAKLAGLNNPAVMKSTFETLQKYHTQIVESGKTGPAVLEQFMQGANEYLSNIQITPADLSKPDKIITQMETVLGKPLDSLTKSIIRTMPQSGNAIAVTELAVPEIMSATDLGAYQKLVANDLTFRGSAELNTINKDITRLNDELKTAPPTTQEGIKTLISWLNQRSTEINNALDLASDSKSPNIFPLVRLYGNAAAMEAKSKDPKLENAPILGIFKEAIESAPVDTGSISLHVELLVRELIRPGDKVTYIGRDGQRVTEVVTADDVKQAKAALGR
jgi:hypothetical protein